MLLGRRDWSCGPVFGAELPIFVAPVRLIGDHSEKEEAMKYMMLIHQGPAIGEFQSLPEEEQRAIYGEWKAINGTPGVSPGL